MITKIISGGQTGADLGGLEAGECIEGMETGGFMPLGWRTQAGPRPEYRVRFGMKETSQKYYPPRTEANVKAADATLIFGNRESRGSRLTIRLCDKHQKPYYLQDFPIHVEPRGFIHSPPSIILEAIVRLTYWLSWNEVGILNVAGNREETNPGIQDFTMAVVNGAVLKVNGEDVNRQPDKGTQA